MSLWGNLQILICTWRKPIHLDISETSHLKRRRTVDKNLPIGAARERASIRRPREVREDAVASGRKRRLREVANHAASFDLVGGLIVFYEFKAKPGGESCGRL